MFFFVRLPEVTASEMPNDSTCVFCFTEMTSGKRIACGHVFHLACLKRWIHANTTQLCPKCNAPIKVEKDEVEKEDDELNIKEEELKKMNEELKNKEILLEESNIGKVVGEIGLIESIHFYDILLGKREKEGEGGKSVVEEIMKLDENAKTSELKFEDMKDIPFEQSKKYV